MHFFSQIWAAKGFSLAMRLLKARDSFGQVTLAWQMGRLWLAQARFRPEGKLKWVGYGWVRSDLD